MEFLSPLENLPGPFSFDKLRMVSLIEPFAKEGDQTSDFRLRRSENWVKNKNEQKSE
jgi:hypothetical protein